MRLQARPMGDEALLVDVTDGSPTALAELVTAAGLADVVEVVPAAQTVLLLCRPGADLAALARVVDALEAAPVVPEPAAGSTDVLDVPVTYDGADLAEVARHTGLTPDAVVEAHTGQLWTVAFCGFAPGFGYLVGEDHRLDVPRRSQPRTRVPTGSVALAGSHTGIYPRPSPGGWQLIGRTDLEVWDLDREPPAMLRPGVRVRFVDTGGGG